MIESILAMAVLAAVVLLVFILGKPRRRDSREISKGPIMVYKSDSNDPVAESYYPGIRGSVGPFPIGKKQERKKTETFQNRR